MADKPRRRWFQFSLRTLFLMVAVLGIGLGWVGSQVRIVRERKAVREWIYHTHGLGMFDGIYGPETGRDVSWFRRMLGDRAMPAIILDATPDELARIKMAFPEAKIVAPPRRPIHF